jgi:hypothetical protein
MLDTVVLTTEHITAEQYTIIQEQLQARSGTDMSTGEVAYLRFVASIPIPTSGASVRCTVDTSKWIKEPGQKVPHRVACKSLRVEGSIHKAMHIHNVFGGEPKPQPAIEWYISLVGSLLGVTLPSLEHWQVARLDFAASFDLGHLDNVRGWIRAKSLVVYPRRQVNFYSDLGMEAPGTTTTLRAYAKGPQFHKEGGYSKMLQMTSPDRAFDVSRLAQRVLRCEIEIKPPKLETIITSAADLTEEALRSLYESEWRRFLRPLDEDTRLAHTAVEVASRLQSEYPGAWLGLYQIWCMLAVRGEQWYRQHVAASTWRGQRAKLEAAKVSWESTNVLTIDAPEDVTDFFPSLAEPRLLTQVLPYPVAS